MALLPCSKYFVKIVEQSTVSVMMEPSNDSNNMTKPAPGRYPLDVAKNTSPVNAA
jgi:hypothetical protein